MGGDSLGHPCLEGSGVKATDLVLHRLQLVPAILQQLRTALAATATVTPGAIGQNPLDTDGDGLSDGDEHFARLGYQTDPLNPDIVYGGKVSRYDRTTGQVQQVGPRVRRGSDYRVVRTMPLL